MAEVRAQTIFFYFYFYNYWLKFDMILHLFWPNLFKKVEQ